MMWGQKTTANDLADSLGDMLALFDDEGNFREEYQDQASVAMERAEANLKNFINGREVSIIGPSSQNVSYDAMKELMWLHDEVAKVLLLLDMTKSTLPQALKEIKRAHRESTIRLMNRN